VSGQVDFEARPLIGFTVNVYESGILLDNSVDHGKTEPGALTHSFGREKRFEYLRKDLFVHAAPVVAHREQDILTWHKTLVSGAKGSIKGFVHRFNGDPAGTRDGITGIDAQIGQNLVDLGGVHSDRPKHLRGEPDQFDPLADQSPQHLEHGFNAFVQVEHSGGDGLLAGEGKQLIDYVGGSLGGLLYLLKMLSQRRRGRFPFLGQFRMTEDNSQHVVEIMGHAAGQPSHCLHLLGLTELFLKFFLFGKVGMGPGHAERYAIFVPGNNFPAGKHPFPVAGFHPQPLFNFEDRGPAFKVRP